MITFVLDAQQEKLAPENPLPKMERVPLYHQWRTWDALGRAHLVVNSYNTGTGKTIASLLHLFRLGRRDNVLFIAPTNALIGQHVADIREFVRVHELPFAVAEVNAAQLRQMAATRSGATLYRLIRNPRDFAESLGLSPEDHARRGLILVTNPDIFYYALFFRHHVHDQRNLFELMAAAFRYVVIDEFHYYHSKQFANFLFYFLLVQQMGWLDLGQRICLLSATPSAATLRFFDETFGDQWTLISPENEPDSARMLATVPTLTPLEVTVVEGELQTWAATETDALKVALESGAHGALISSSLARINETFALLRPALGEAVLGRITGPEPETKRQVATARPLILATPTVDIGYNFKKLDKARQNVDFLACDGRFADELVQRMGRAGRVLGKAVTDQPSHATLVLPAEMVDAFRPLSGKALGRGDFARWVATESGLPHKHDLGAYIRSHAIMESFYPLWRLERLADPSLRSDVEALYERVVRVFAPTARKRSKWGPILFFRKYEERQHWLRAVQKGGKTENNATAQLLADFLRWSRAVDYDEELKAKDVRYLLPQLTANPDWWQKLCDFATSQVVLTTSLFSFRDSFQGVTAALYDPQGLLSSETWNEYDLLHVLSNYRYTLLDRDAFKRLGGESPDDAALYLRLVHVGLNNTTDQATRGLPW